MKLTKNIINKIIAEEKRKKLKEAATRKRGLIKEDEQAPYPSALRDVAPVEAPLNVSLDQAVDKYLVRYEREAIPTSALYEKAFTKRSLSSLFEAILREQDDAAAPPEEDPMADAGGGGDPAAGGGADDGSGGGGGGGAGKPLTKTPRININNFAMSVARLINNYESLMDPKSIILNRAKQYIQTNYDERTGKELLDILSNTYDLRPMTTQQAIDGQSSDEAIGSQFGNPRALGSGGAGELSAPSGGGS